MHSRHSSIVFQTIRSIKAQAFQCAMCFLDLKVTSNLAVVGYNNGKKVVSFDWLKQRYEKGRGETSAAVTACLN